MKSRKNHILSLLIVTVLASIGVSATETFAQTTTTILANVRARLTDPTLSPPIILEGLGHIEITGSVIKPGTFNLTDVAGPGGHAQISWSTGTVHPNGRFRVIGQAVARWTDSSMTVQYRHFRVVIRGRTNSASYLRGRFHDFGGGSPAHLTGVCRSIP